MMTKKPDFLLVGAPKCGTSTLCDWIDQHPSIYVMSPREPNFFARDLVMPRHFNSAEEYQRQFVGHERQLCGEGTTWYLYSRSAPQEIFDYNSDARILIILRNPVEVVHSLHSYRLYYGNESDSDLERVLNREETALKHWEATGERKDVMQIYLDVARYTLGVKRYLNRFGANQVKVVFFDDLRDHPHELLNEIFSFLQVAQDFRPILTHKNEGGTYKSQAIGTILQRPAPSFRALARLLPRSWRHSLGRTIRKMNTEYGSKPPLPQPLRARILKSLNPDIEELELLLNRDISSWRQ